MSPRPHRRSAPMKSLCVAGLTTLAAWWSAAPAAAAFLVTDSGYTAGSTVFNQNGLGQFDQPVGYRFTVGPNDLAVTALGDWDSKADGLTSPIFVALWDTATATPLASATVPAGTAGTLGATDYRFVTLASPVTLLAGHSYTIADRRTPAGGIQTQEDLSSGPAAFSPDDGHCAPESVVHDIAGVQTGMNDRPETPMPIKKVTISKS